MKKVSILAGFLACAFSSTSFAYPLPKNFCYQGCSQQQIEIWDRFEQSTSFETSREAKVYSGACYHLTRMYRNNQAHYAAVLVDHNENGSLTFSGIFSFFAANTYANWDLQKARSEFKMRHELELGGSEAFAELNPRSGTKMYYWLKDQPQTGNLLLVATWGISHQIFCELSPNEGVIQ